MDAYPLTVATAIGSGDTLRLDTGVVFNWSTGTIKCPRTSKFEGPNIASYSYTGTDKFFKNINTVVDYSGINLYTYLSTGDQTLNSVIMNPGKAKLPNMIYRLATPYYLGSRELVIEKGNKIFLNSDLGGPSANIVLEDERCFDSGFVASNLQYRTYFAAQSNSLWGTNRYHSLSRNYRAATGSAVGRDMTNKGVRILPRDAHFNDVTTSAKISTDFYNTNSGLSADFNNTIDGSVNNAGTFIFLANNGKNILYRVNNVGNVPYLLKFLQRIFQEQEQLLIVITTTQSLLCRLI
jgi:hypothetical protein